MTLDLLLPGSMCINQEMVEVFSRCCAS